ncbi:transglutaminase family protein [Huintestinicola sp.]|uniref:transglutaminase family protein n=1 Tax=Huintestinicola sp. TaxID=2981661 RepID=UPI003D7EEB1E
MKRLRFEYETKLEFTRSVTSHSFTLRCVPFSDGRQVITEPVCDILPKTGSIWRSRDSFGNMLICGRMDEPHDEFSFKVTGEAQILNSCESYGTAPEFYRFSSPLTVPGENITAFYKEHASESADLLTRAVGLSESVYKAMTYERGVTEVGTTAEEAMAGRVGVCQDYAHILLALLRMDGIRSRYVSGLAFECGETHAWVEVNDGSRWIGIDPTHNRLIGDCYIKLCHGRDYSDCPIERGIYLGNAGSVQTISSRITDN